MPENHALAVHLAIATLGWRRAFRLVSRMYPPIVTQCFKAYDIRGRAPAQLNEDIAYRIGRSLAVELQGKSVDISALKPLKILADPGSGTAGLIFKALAARLPFQWVFINEPPDGHFPNGVPNPLLPENRELTHRALLANQCDMGLSWDGDVDRCFFFDAPGRFIEGYYLVGLLAQALLRQRPGRKIIHDPRLTWNTIEQVELAGGVAIQSKTRRAFINEHMRSEGAVYGGEMSAHHYFRDLAYCDSGMFPWLLSALMPSSGKALAQLVDERIEAYPCSGEINYRVRASRKYFKSFRLTICCTLRKSIEQMVSVFLFRTGVSV